MKIISKYFDKDIIEKYKTKEIRSKNNQYENYKPFISIFPPVFGKLYENNLINDENDENFDEFLDDIYIILLELSVRRIEEWPLAREELQQNKLPIKYEQYGIKEEMIIKTTIQEEKTKQLFDLLGEKITFLKKKYEKPFLDNILFEEFKKSKESPRISKEMQLFSSYKGKINYKQKQKYEIPFSVYRIEKLFNIIGLIEIVFLEIWDFDENKKQVILSKRNYDFEGSKFNYIFNYKLFFILNICYICIFSLKKSIL